LGGVGGERGEGEGRGREGERGGGNGTSFLGSGLIKFYLAIEIKGWVEDLVEGGRREINF
jgi:hypothetical protein